MDEFMKNISLFLVLMFSFSLSAAQKIAATVNGDEITMNELEDYYQQNQLYSANRVITRQSALDDLINRKLTIQKAKKNKLDKDPIVQKKMDDILSHAQISKDLEGYSGKIRVNDSDVKKYYNKNKEYRTAHILLRMRAIPSKEEVQKAFDMALKIYQEAKNNPDKFGELAKQYSQASNAASGGDLGFQLPTRYPPQYYQAIRDKKVGYITKPVRTQYGFHIVKVLGEKKYDQIEKNFYKKIVYDMKRDKIINNYYQKLRKSAKIKSNI